MSSRQTRLGHRLGAFVVGLAAASVAVAGNASAFWSTAGVPTAASAADAFPTSGGAKPTTTVNGQNIDINFAAVNTSGGVPASGYLIRRYAAASGGSALSFFACTRQAGLPNCQDTANGATTTFYSYQPKLQTNWAGAESARTTSGVATVPLLLDLTPTCPASGAKKSAVNVSATRPNTTGSLDVTLSVATGEGKFGSSQSTTKTITAGNSSTGNAALTLDNSTGTTVVTFAASGYNDATCSITRTVN